MTDFSGIAVAIPAHQEAATIDRALVAVLGAARAPHPVVIVVAADSCTDGTAAVVRRRAEVVPAHVEVHVLELRARSAGVARQAACVAADRRLQALVGATSARWIATTDADSTVPVDWLDNHRRWVRRGADAVAGLVRVDPRSTLPPSVWRHVDTEFARADLGHRHVYGANLGVTAAWWAAAGGFPAVETGEDERFVARLRAAGASVVSITDTPVLTSGRLAGRAPAGFGAHLAALVLES